MIYSCEEIFKEYGQFNAFVELTFSKDSDASKKFGRILLGTFKYERKVRDELQNIINAKGELSSNNGYICFQPSDVPKKLDKNLAVDLDKKGILNTDIEIIASLNTPRTNRYTTKGEREIANSMIIEFDPGGLTVDQMKLGDFRMRLDSGYPLIEAELEQYIGLELFHSPERLSQEMQTMQSTVGIHNKNIRYFYLNTKFVHSELEGKDMEEYNAIRTERSIQAYEVLRAELLKSTDRLNEIATNYKDRLDRILWITVSFETGVILPYKFPIWWNLERFLHIYIRHVKETNVGEKFNGSLFKYKFDDVRRIVSGVIKSVYSEIETHFKEDSTKVFFRGGKRAIEYDGVYYRVEIESSGLVRTFHPEGERE